MSSVCMSSRLTLTGGATGRELAELKQAIKHRTVLSDVDCPMKKKNKDPSITNAENYKEQCYSKDLFNNRSICMFEDVALCNDRIFICYTVKKGG